MNPTAAVPLFWFVGPRRVIQRGSHGERTAAMEISARINQHVMSARARGGLESAFSRWRDRHDALEVARNVDELIELLRSGPRSQYPQKNDALRALCLEAAGGDELAGALLLWLLLPALLLEWKRVHRRDALSPEDLESELLAGFWESITWIRPASRKVAARLIQGARRRAIAAVRRDSVWVHATDPVALGDVPVASSGEELDPFASLDEAASQGVLSPLDVEVLLATPEGLKAVAEREGLTVKATRLRRGRARRRLIGWLDGSSEPSARKSHQLSQRRPA